MWTLFPRGLRHTISDFVQPVERQTVKSVLTAPHETKKTYSFLL